MTKNKKAPPYIKYVIFAAIGLALIPEKWLPDWVPSLELDDEKALLPSLLTLAALTIPVEKEKSLISVQA